MCADFVAPAPSFTPPPDMLKAYLDGQLAPFKVAAQQLDLEQGSLKVAPAVGPTEPAGQRLQ